MILLPDHAGDHAGPSEDQRDPSQQDILAAQDTTTENRGVPSSSLGPAIAVPAGVPIARVLPTFRRPWITVGTTLQEPFGLPVRSPAMV